MLRRHRSLIGVGAVVVVVLGGLAVLRHDSNPSTPYPFRVATKADSPGAAALLDPTK